MFGLSIRLFLYVFCTFLAQVIIHETGHLVFGKITGYRFLAFRIFNIVLIKDNQSYSHRRYRGMGTLGQCLMKPPAKENYPFVWMTIGGIVLNVVTAMISTAFVLSPLKLPLVHSIGLLLFAFYGYSFALLNGYPNRKSGISNDGLVLHDLLKDPYARICYQRQFDVVSELLKGKTYSEMPGGILEVPEGSDLTNTVIGYHKILECYRLMDLRDWHGAKNCLEEFYPHLEMIPEMIRNIVLSEDLFLRMKLGDTTVKESGIYDTVKQYLKKNSGDCNTVRVRIIYDICNNPTDADRNKIRKKLYDFQKDCIYPGEAKFCKALIQEFI